MIMMIIIADFLRGLKYELQYESNCNMNQCKGKTFPVLRETFLSTFEMSENKVDVYHLQYLNRISLGFHPLTHSSLTLYTTSSLKPVSYMLTLIVCLKLFRLLH